MDVDLERKMWYILGMKIKEIKHEDLTYGIIKWKGKYYEEGVEIPEDLAKERLHQRIFDYVHKRHKEELEKFKK
jgi:hypothetical protein